VCVDTIDEYTCVYSHGVFILFTYRHRHTDTDTKTIYSWTTIVAGPVLPHTDTDR